MFNIAAFLIIARPPDLFKKFLKVYFRYWPLDYDEYNIGNIKRLNTY